MNHFVYYHLCALSYHVSKESFLVAKKWRDLELFTLIIDIFSSPEFKSLTREEQDKIYGYIDELRAKDIDREEKKKCLTICLEQLESILLKEEYLSRTLKKKD